MLILLLLVLRKRNITSVLGIPIDKKSIVFLSSSMSIGMALKYLGIGHPDVSAILQFIFRNV
jgi:hypothetical protein